MDRPLRATFAEDAERYDRARPGYPAELFDDLASLTGLRPGNRILEIGPGTGQATVPLAAARRRHDLASGRRRRGVPRRRPGLLRALSFPARSRDRRHGGRIAQRHLPELAVARVRP